jgi:alkylation response protein AidB-like acyl-CoA dehydrogenase
MCSRAAQRRAFGRLLSEHGSIQHDIARSRVEIDTTRLLCHAAAHCMDLHGNKVAKSDIGAAKIEAPSMAKRVVERAMQCHGGMGVSQDTVLAHFWAGARSLQLADGPDEVHLTALAKHELREQLR